MGKEFLLILGQGMNRLEEIIIDKRSQIKYRIIIRPNIIKITCK